MIDCAECGASNPDDATFCHACHHFLAWGPTSPTPKQRARPKPATGTTGAPDAPEPAPTVSPLTPLPLAPTVPPVPPTADVLGDALDDVRTARRLAEARDRDDLASHLERAQERISRRLVSVAVVGEFKRGKSTLVNALLRTAVCPVDADLVTAVPTVVRFGETPTATAFVEPAEPDAPAVTEVVALDALQQYVSEAGNPGNARRLQSVEVQVPHPLLRNGLCLVDTPGVGGLDSAHGLVTLGALAQAQALLFLTDASQELTGPELDFLRDAVQRCPLAACVVTKTDLHVEWRRMVELDEAHLRRAGLDMPVIAVSSFLRLGDWDDPGILAESGFPALVDFVLGNVVPQAEAQVAEAAGREVDFVAAQLEDEVALEQQVLDEPETADTVVEKLDEARQTTRKLVSPTSTWQQMLTDGVQDLVAEVEFDLLERLRDVLRDVDRIIDDGDPKQTWPDIEVWLRRQAAAAAVANHEHMHTLADDLATSVAEAFNLVAAQVTSAQSVHDGSAVAQIEFASLSTLDNPAGKLAPMLMAGRTATLIPMLLLGTLGHVLLPVIAPIALVLAGGIGQKVIRDERKRQLAFRRQQAKQAAKRYVDEVAFVIGKDSRDALRATQRRLRDDFQGRAQALHRFAESSLASVQAAAALPEEDRRARAEEVAREGEQVRALRARPTVGAGSRDG